MTENQLKFLEYEERRRHNAATEAVDVGKLQETERSNRAKETETERSNRIHETLTGVDVTGKFAKNVMGAITDVMDFV